MADGYIIDRGNIEEPGRLPMFKYTGRYKLEDKGLNGETRNWVIKFQTSGEFTVADDMAIELRFLSNHVSNASFQNKWYARSLTARKAVKVVVGDVNRILFGGYSPSGMVGAGGVIEMRNAR